MRLFWLITVPAVFFLVVGLVLYTALNNANFI